MILIIHTNASYLKKSGVKSCIGGYSYLINRPKTRKINKNNSIHVEYNNMQNLLVFSMESELGEMLKNT